MGGWADPRAPVCAMMAAVRVLPFPVLRGAASRATWPTLVTDDAGTLPAQLTVEIGREPVASVRVTLARRGRTVQGRGTGSLGSALDDLAAALWPAYLRACTTCRLATPGNAGATCPQDVPGGWDADRSGVSVGLLCHRIMPPDPVLDTHWCDRYERIGSPR